MRIGIDLGFEQVKACWGDGENLKIPSVIGEPVGEEINDGGISKYSAVDDLFIIYQGKRYYVGNKAIRETNNARLTIKADKTNDVSDMVKYLTVLGFILQPTEEAVVVTGLPVDEYNDLKDTVRGNMSGSFDYIYRGVKRMNPTIKKVVVIPQGAGAYYHHILDSDGGINLKNNLINRKVTVLDFGSRTTNVVTMLKGRYISKESFTVFKGVINVHNNMRKIIYQKYGINFRPADMDQITRQGYITISGQSESVQDIIDQSVAIVVDDILSEIRMHITDHRLIDVFLMTGGGASLMSNFVENEYPDHTITLEDAEYNNANGYLKYSLFLEKAGQ